MSSPCRFRAQWFETLVADWLRGPLFEEKLFKRFGSDTS